MEITYAFSFLTRERCESHVGLSLLFHLFQIFLATFWVIQVTDISDGFNNVVFIILIAVLSTKHEQFQGKFHLIVATKLHQFCLCI